MDENIPHVTRRILHDPVFCLWQRKHKKTGVVLRTLHVKGRVEGTPKFTPARSLPITKISKLKDGTYLLETTGKKSWRLLELPN